LVDLGECNHEHPVSENINKKMLPGKARICFPQLSVVFFAGAIESMYSTNNKTGLSPS
jgi:hypothetical protein